MDNEITRRQSNMYCSRIEEMTQFLATDSNINHLKIFGTGEEQINDYDDYREAVRKHEAKLANAHQGGIFYCEDDKHDFEGERLIREAQSMRNELIQRGFYDTSK